MAVSSVAIGATQAKAPANDSFSGSITAATGSFKHDRGKVSIDLTLRSGHATRRLTLTMHGQPCESKRCVALIGKLRGTLMTDAEQIPDVGSRFTARAAGAIDPLGHVFASGTAQGTGFVERGLETLKLTLTAKHGTITVNAHTRSVPGFTSP